MTGFDPATLAISDHAVLRWMERMHGMDVATLRRRVAAFQNVAHVKDATVVRFLEIGMGLSLEGLRDEMRDLVASMPSIVKARQAVAGGPDMRLVIQRDLGIWTVTTVLTGNMEHRTDGMTA